MTIEELRTAIAALAGEDADISMINSALDDMGRMTDGQTAKIEALEGEIAELKTKYNETAARNYELMQSVTSAKNDDEEEYDDEAADVSKLFKKD